MVNIKICGISRKEDMAMVNEAIPDYIGFVFAKSKRQVTWSQAKELKDKLDPRIQAVGVFVNEAPDRVIQLCRERIIDLIQLHGEEDEDYINILRASINNPIIKAIRVKSSLDIIAAERYTCDYLLFDAYHKDQYGGSGEGFDWSLMSTMEKPFFLAGGINIDNVDRAIKSLQPFAVDISSGVETEGLKDRDKIIDIIRKVRRVSV